MSGRWPLGFLLWLVSHMAMAADLPAIREIAFEGNTKTQPKVMLRELVIQPGDAADPARIERSRQGILDLGLFQNVTVKQTPIEGDEGGIKLTFVVREKWYILPLPRAAANLDGQSSVGAELRWNNLFGLNHSLRAQFTQNDLRQSDRGKQTSYLVAYAAPFFLDSPYNLRVAAQHRISPVEEEVFYDERFDSASVFVSRTYSDGGPASQGWTLGSGLIWQNEKREGEGVPPAYGEATAPTFSAGYRDIRFKLYSEEGIAYGASVTGAREGYASDYNYSRINANYQRLLAIGETPHQNLNFSAGIGSYFDGPDDDDVTEYSLGGSGSLRGYDVNTFEGNAYYLLAVEYVRPIRWPWLRVAAIIEAGRIFERPQDLSLRDVRTSAGVSLRIRVPTFVNLELEIGCAVPLDGGPGRLFGGRI